MGNRPVAGTTAWIKCELVVDVPTEARYISLGCRLIGTGKLWFDDLKFEVVGKNVPVTDTYVDKEKIKLLPQNLDFEEMN